MEVQTIRVAKTVSKKEATEIVKKLGYKTNIKPNPQYLNFHSFRQIQPNKFIKDSFKYKELKKNPKIFLIIGKLKK